MIATDGRQTIANARPTASERIRQARALREAALDALDPPAQPNRGAADNGQQWNDGYCACGVAICDSPAGDKCWDCFNYDPDD